MLIAEVLLKLDQSTMFETKYTDGPKMNENGDEIVFEGIRNPTKLIIFLVVIFSFMMIGSCGLLLLFLPFIIVMLYCVLFRKWRLYITHSELHYSLGFEYTITPFSDISLITVVPGTNKILVNRKHGSTLYSTHNGVIATNELRIDGVANYKEFVAAVKEEMARMQSDC